VARVVRRELPAVPEDDDVAHRPARDHEPDGVAAAAVGPRDAVGGSAGDGARGAEPEQDRHQTEPAARHAAIVARYCEGGMPSVWPAASYETWSETCDTLHAHTQVLGKLA